MPADTSLNATLGRAREARKDEFYTQLNDIEDELRHYKKHFRGKVILCNCDDPYESNFFKYFALNFNRLGLKKLIATCYSGSPITGTQLSLFGETTEEERRTPYKAVVTTVHDTTGDGGVDMLDVAELFRLGENSIERLDGDGDFRSAECVALLDEADIVVTNPPFSLFRQYVTQLVEHGKGFVIIGPTSGTKYKETFPLIKGNKMWLGYGFANGDSYFKVPSENARDYADGVYDPQTGLVHFRNVTWFTNLDIKKRHDERVLVRRYSPDDYRSYTNFDGIDVPQLANIPCDWAGNMGVPITFLQEHNPEQFEIVGLGEGDLAKEIGITRNHEGRTKVEYQAEDGSYKRPWARIIIRNLHPEEPRP